MIPELLWSALPAVGLLAAAALALAVWVATPAVAVAVPRSRAVGGRSRDHAIMLRVLPASSHPDAAGHSRSRAPGSLPPAA
ncbi:MAG TPA: DUF6412 domain-containing protein [Pseudolysinimonas sp.]|nr:DUF6412 domain-containing protein [Pseudolysinimonas sp.]